MKDWKKWRALVYMQIIEFRTVIFALFLCSFGSSCRALVAYHLERGGMPFVLTLKKAPLLISRSRCLVHGRRCACWIIVRAISDLT